jgi:hypothetical protein
MQPTRNADNVANGVPIENGDGRPKPQDIGGLRGRSGQRRGKEEGRKRANAQSGPESGCQFHAHD